MPRVIELNPRLFVYFVFGNFRVPVECFNQSGKGQHPLMTEIDSHVHLLRHCATGTN